MTRFAVGNSDPETLMNQTDYDDIGFLTCKYWLTAGLWREELPLTDLPLRGVDAVKQVLTTDDPTTVEAFIVGWDRYMDSNPPVSLTCVDDLE